MGSCGKSKPTQQPLQRSQIEDGPDRLPGTPLGFCMGLCFFFLDKSLIQAQHPEGEKWLVIFQDLVLQVDQVGIFSSGGGLHAQK